METSPLTTHKDRLAAAWSFREPDRVPIELTIDPELRHNPGVDRLFSLIDEFLYLSVKIFNARFETGNDLGFVHDREGVITSELVCADFIDL